MAEKVSKTLMVLRKLEGRVATLEDRMTEMRDIMSDVRDLLRIGLLDRARVDNLDRRVTALELGR